MHRATRSKSRGIVDTIPLPPLDSPTSTPMPILPTSASLLGLPSEPMPPVPVHGSHLDLETFNVLAPRLLELTAAHDEKDAHTLKYEGIQNQMTRDLYYYTLGREELMPLEWRPVATQLTRETTDPEYIEYLRLQKKFGPTSAPTHANADTPPVATTVTVIINTPPVLDVPAPRIRRLHNQLNSERYPWSNQAALRTEERRKRTHAVDFLASKAKRQRLLEGEDGHDGPKRSAHHPGPSYPLLPSVSVHTPSRMMTLRDLPQSEDDDDDVIMVG